MADYFIESSALVKGYVPERGSAWMRSLIDVSAANVLFVARLALVEVISAIVRADRAGRIPAGQRTTLVGEFGWAFMTRYVKPRPREELWIESTAVRLVETHALRGADAIHLASGLLKARQVSAAGSTLTLISADAELNRAARAEGLIVDDPNLHP